MKTTQKKQNTVKEYIENFPTEIKKRLRTLRSLVKKHASGAEEKLSYGMPSFHLNGRLLYFAAFKNHIGFYPMTTGIKEFKKEISKYKFAKGSVQFPHSQELPVQLIAKVIKFRVKENTRRKNEI